MTVMLKKSIFRPLRGGFSFVMNSLTDLFYFSAPQAKKNLISYHKIKIIFNFPINFMCRKRVENPNCAFKIPKNRLRRVQTNKFMRFKANLRFPPAAGGGR